MLELHQPGDYIQQRYEIVKTIGQGGGGTTYEAKDLYSDQRVAIKSLSLKQIQNWKTFELLEREANVLAELDHPAIPQYLDHFIINTQHEYSFYLVQELAPGKSIATLVENGWQPTEKVAKDIAYQVLQVLDYLHSQVPPILHRDIKPENLIYTKTGKIYLVDFGAVQAAYNKTINTTFVGTLGYMPLEQINGKAQPASDLYALGASLVYLLTGCSPSELPQKHLKIDFRNSTVTSVSKQFANWLENMLEPDVDNRFQSAKEALQKRSEPAKKPSQFYQHQILNFSRALMFLLLVPSLLIVGTLTAATVGNLNTWLNSTKSQKNNNQPSTSYTDQNNNEARSSSLLYAAKSRNLEIVERALSNGANLNQTDNNGRTPLYLAARYGNPEIVSRLLAAGAEVETRTYENGRTPLYIASGFGNLEVVKQLLEAGARVNAKTYNGWRPIHNASKHGHFNIVKQLLAADARVNVKTNEGLTPLTLADNEHIRRLLLRNGAEPSRQ